MSHDRRAATVGNGGACLAFAGAQNRYDDVLRAHCDAEGRDYDEITKTCYFVFDVGDKGEEAAQVVDQLGELAGLGFQAAVGPVVNVWQITPLEIIGSEVIPAFAGLCRRLGRLGHEHWNPRAERAQQVPDVVGI